jgi:hypothetical protein
MNTRAKAAMVPTAVAARARVAAAGTSSITSWWGFGITLIGMVFSDATHELVRPSRRRPCYCFRGGLSRP